MLLFLFVSSLLLVIFFLLSALIKRCCTARSKLASTKYPMHRLAKQRITRDVQSAFWRIPSQRAKERFIDRANLQSTLGAWYCRSIHGRPENFEPIKFNHPKTPRVWLMFWTEDFKGQHPRNLSSLCSPDWELKTSYRMKMEWMTKNAAAFWKLQIKGNVPCWSLLRSKTANE